jgi:NAD(P)-dependent dehydrogenase (short-subunit alcohol dehydrogenase family)
MSLNNTSKTFAIAGGLTSGYSPVSAGLGAFIARALVEQGAKEVRILGRGEKAVSDRVTLIQVWGSSSDANSSGSNAFS